MLSTFILYDIFTDILFHICIYYIIYINCIEVLFASYKIHPFYFILFLKMFIFLSYPNTQCRVQTYKPEIKSHMLH